MLDVERAEQLWMGRCQVAANLTAQTLTRDAGIVEASELRFARVMRWCLHPDLRKHGLGERLLKESLSYLKSLPVDAVAAHFGATSWLIKLWLRQGARVVHLSHGCDPSSGQHSVSVLIPLTDHAKHVTEVLQTRLEQQLPELLLGPLSDLAGEALTELLQALTCRKACHQDELDAWSFAFGARCLSNCTAGLRCVVLESLQTGVSLTPRDAKILLDLLQGRPILSEGQLRHAVRRVLKSRRYSHGSQHLTAEGG